MEASTLPEALAHTIWRSRFQWRDNGHAHEPTLAASWERVALAVSAAETRQRAVWQQRFREILDDHRFLPSTQLLQAAGAYPYATLAS